MDIIGIQEFGHDTSAVLLEDNKIKLAIEEERINRVKHSSGFSFGGGAPLDSLKYCLKNCNSSIDRYSFGWDITANTIFNLIKRGLINKVTGQGTVMEGVSFSKLTYGHTIGLWKRKNFLASFGKSKASFIDHHLSHAASAYRCSGFKNANILVLDGAGEKNSTSLYVGKTGNISKLKSFPAINSLGQLYESITSILGMGMFGEGKTMGLAPYGRYNDFYSDILEINRGEYFVKWNKVKKLKMYERGEGEITKEHKDIAATLQAELEKTALMLVEQLYKQTGYKNLCLAGGVALNCKMNSALLNPDFVNDIYIPSAPHDAGTALGAALEVAYNQGCRFDKLDTACLGPGYTNEEIKNELKKHKLDFSYHKDIEGAAAELISKGNVIGWFQGRMEFGPRALGNRSILADPTNSKIADRVNDIKHREKWRPLAPSVIEEKMGKYFERPYPSPFMSLAFQVKEEKQKEVLAVVHVDGSARVQTVSKNVNPRFYRLIKEFSKLKGVPVVLNTSFNDKNQPIVMTPKDAVESFKRMGLDKLVIGDYVIK